MLRVYVWLRSMPSCLQVRLVDTSKTTEPTSNGGFTTVRTTAYVFLLLARLSSKVACPPGRFANKTASGSCLPCAKGSYAPTSGSIGCTFAEPGFYVTDASMEQKECPPGRASVGGADSCRSCPLGEVQPNSGQTQCIAAEPGTFVNATGATISTPCPAGRFSLGAGSGCDLCKVGEFQPETSQSSCKVRSAKKTSVRTDPTGLSVSSDDDGTREDVLRRVHCIIFLELVTLEE